MGTSSSVALFTKLVKASDPHNPTVLGNEDTEEENDVEGGRVRSSKLSAMDMLIPHCFRINLTFFYDYLIDGHSLQLALTETLNRYPELSGRMSCDNTAVDLVNHGAQLVYVEPSAHSIEDLKENDFNYEFCCKHFGKEPRFSFGDLAPDHFLMKLTGDTFKHVQNLANNSGMAVNFRFNHILCDINACYLFVADFCSQVRSQTYKFTEVKHCVRRDYVIPSGDEPKFDHPGMITTNSKFDLQKIKLIYIRDVADEPPKTVTALLTEKMMKQLKKDIYSEASKSSLELSDSEHIRPSTNDCIISVILQAYCEIKTTISTKPPDEKIYPWFLPVNIRFRRDPKIPETFFGNMFLTAYGEMTSLELHNLELYEIATRIRKEVLKINEAYCQSAIDKINQYRYAQLSGLFDLDTMRFSNWNNFFDWYGDADLGQGRPLKFASYSKRMDRFCYILPAPANGDLECNVSLPEDVLEAFKQHKNVKKYFKIK